MTSHTPGPWSISGRCVRANGYLVAIPAQLPSVVVDGVFQDTPESKRALEEEACNARLIAAAPDMLAALKAYAAWFSDPATCTDPVLKPMRQNVLAAIAKATGCDHDEAASTSV